MNLIFLPRLSIHFANSIISGVGAAAAVAAAVTLNTDSKYIKESFFSLLLLLLLLSYYLNHKQEKQSITQIEWLFKCLLPVRIVIAKTSNSN